MTTTVNLVCVLVATGLSFGASPAASGQQPAGQFAFGASQSNPQSTAAPAFGSGLTGFGATSAPAFGASSVPAFGASSVPAFGATQGSAPVFGAASGSAPAFGAMQAFDAQSTPAFGAASAPAFGAASGPGTGFPFGGTSSPPRRIALPVLWCFTMEANLNCKCADILLLIRGTRQAAC